MSKKFVFSNTIIGYKNLKREIQKYDGVILGSDQVWNPINLGTDYFNLLFVPDEMKKCTYASSFGVSQIPRFQINKTKKFLSRIDKISVREPEGVKIVKELTDNTVFLALDPTLLLSAYEWNKYIPRREIIDTEYVFAYFVGANPAHRNIAEKISNELGCPLILIPHVDEYVKEERKYETEISMCAGPSEFVNLIRHAKWILTDSFHATVFSIIYEKQFSVLKRFLDSDKRNMNSRINNILLKLNLQSTQISTFKDWEMQRNIQIDYKKVKQRLENEKIDSYKYLESLLEYIKQ